MGRTIYVDGECEEEVTEIAYASKDGKYDRLTYGRGKSFFVFTPNASDSALVYVKDIPKLIKALEIAQKEWGD